MNRLPTKQELTQSVISLYILMLNIEKKYKPLVEAERARHKSIQTWRA